MGTFLDKGLLLGIFTKNWFLQNNCLLNNKIIIFYWIKDDYRHLQADTDANILLFRFRGFFKNVFLHFYFAGRKSPLNLNQTVRWTMINHENDYHAENSESQQNECFAQSFFTRQ